jgi:hypothetical protein
MVVYVLKFENDYYKYKYHTFKKNILHCSFFFITFNNFDMANMTQMR